MVRGYMHKKTVMLGKKLMASHNGSRAVSVGVDISDELMEAARVIIANQLHLEDPDAVPSSVVFDEASKYLKTLIKYLDNLNLRESRESKRPRRMASHTHDLFKSTGTTCGYSTTQLIKGCLALIIQNGLKQELPKIEDEILCDSSR